jgi:hypothetical protein
MSAHRVRLLCAALLTRAYVATPRLVLKMQRMAECGAMSSNVVGRGGTIDLPDDNTRAIESESVTHGEYVHESTLHQDDECTTPPRRRVSHDPLRRTTRCDARSTNARHLDFVHQRNTAASAGWPCVPSADRRSTRAERPCRRIATAVVDEMTRFGRSHVLARIRDTKDPCSSGVAIVRRSLHE